MTLAPNESAELEFVNILKSKHARYIDGTRVVDADAVADTYVPPGAAFGKIDNSGQYGPVTRDTIAAAGANASANTIPLKNLNAVDWHNWQVGDAIGITSGTAQTIAAVAASLQTGVEGDNNAIGWVAQDAGTVGNGISRAMTAVADGQSLATAVAGNDITVTLETDDGDSATITIGDGSVTATIDAAGSAGNDKSIIVEYGTTSGALAAAEAVDVLTVTLGMDANDNPDNVKNTATLVAAAIDGVAGYSGSVSGTGTDIINDEEAEKSFTGGGANFAIASTATEVIASIETSGDASALVAVTDVGASTGAGTVTAVTAANLSGGADSYESTSTSTDTATITVIDEAGGELTVDSISTNYAEDVVVEKNDGSSTAKFICLELADVSEEDALVGGIEHGAVYSGRMPNYDAIVAADLPQISF